MQYFCRTGQTPTVQFIKLKKDFDERKKLQVLDHSEIVRQNKEYEQQRDVFPVYSNKTKILYTEKKPKPVPPPFIRTTCPKSLRSKPMSRHSVNKVKTSSNVLGNLDETSVNHSPEYRVDINSKLDQAHNNRKKIKPKREPLFRKQVLEEPANVEELFVWPEMPAYLSCRLKLKQSLKYPLMSDNGLEFQFLRENDDLINDFQRYQPKKNVLKGVQAQYIQDRLRDAKNQTRK